MVSKIKFLFLTILFATQFVWAEVIVSSEEQALLSYKERRQTWAFVVGAAALRDEVAKVTEPVAQLGVRVGLQKMVDFGFQYKYHSAAGFHQHIYGAGVWLPYFWKEPYVVPFLQFNIHYPSLVEVSQFNSGEVGVLIGLNAFEPIEAFRLRSEWGLEQVYLHLSYFESLDSNVSFDGYHLGIIFEF